MTARQDAALTAEQIEAAYRKHMKQHDGTTFVLDRPGFEAALASLPRQPSAEEVREACARVCNKLFPLAAYESDARRIADDCAKAIRSFDLSRIGGEGKNVVPQGAPTRKDGDGAAEVDSPRVESATSVNAPACSPTGTAPFNHITHGICPDCGGEYGHKPHCARRSKSQLKRIAAQVAPTAAPGGGEGLVERLMENAEHLEAPDTYTIAIAHTASLLREAAARIASLEADLSVLATCIRTGFEPPQREWTDDIYRKTAFRAVELHKYISSSTAADGKEKV